MASTSIYHATATELDAMTKAYFEADGGSAWDTLHNMSYAVNYFDKQKKGLFKVVKGGNGFTFPVLHDKVSSMPYNRASTTIARDGAGGSSAAATNQVTVLANFPIRNIISSVTMLRLDEIQNAGAQALANILKTRIDACVAGHGEELSRSLYYARDTNTGVKVFDGIRMCCYAQNPSQGNYGSLAYDTPENSVWAGRTSTDYNTHPISLQIVRALRKEAKFRDGPNARPDFVLMPEELFSSIQDISGTLIRLDGNTDAAKFGFVSVIHEGAQIVADDYATANTVSCINSKYWGLRFLEGGHHERGQWYMLEATAGDKRMDIFANGNWVTPARRAHIHATGIVA